MVRILPMIDLDHDVVSGKWRRTNLAITCAAGPLARLALPYEPAEEYDVHFDCIVAPEGNAVLILRHGGTAFLWRMGLLSNTAGGFEQIKGKPASANPTTVRRDPFLTPGIRHNCIVQVRNHSLAAYVDGVLLVRYVTDYSDLALPTEWSLPRPVLGIGADKSFVRIMNLHVMEITGEGKLLAPPASNPPAISAATRGTDR
jgi:hypothetical protein